TLDDARHLAQEYLVYVRHGQDPAAIRQAARQAPTLAELAERYLAHHAQVKKKPSSAAPDSRKLRRRIRPPLGDLRLQHIAHADLAPVHHQMRTTPVTANRALSRLSHMFNMAEQWGLRPQHSNPVHGLERYPEKKRERHLSPDELRRLGAVLQQAE